MTQKKLRTFINEICSKPPKRKYVTNKTDVYHIDDIWSLDILDLKDYGPENKRGYRYVLVIIVNFSKFGWTVPLKNKNAQTKKDPSKIFRSYHYGFCNIFRNIFNCCSNWFEYFCHIFVKVLFTKFIL